MKSKQTLYAEMNYMEKKLRSLPWIQVTIQIKKKKSIK